jgi:DNA-binding MarR family transcriptional regulator
MARIIRQEYVESILRLADKLFRELLPAVPEELLVLDITMPQLKILVLLYIRGNLKMSNLASELQVTMATATGLVDRLVERGYIIRESLPEDRRVVLCRLSESGQKTVSSIWESAGKRSQELLEALDNDHLQMLCKVLNKMLETAKYEIEEKKISGKNKRTV